jgi:uncharacterized protein with PQ loop repeat
VRCGAGTAAAAGFASSVRSDAGRVFIISAITVAAVCANIAFVWPQAVRALRSRDLDGVSPGTWTISVTLFSVWASFALRTGYWPLLVANLSCLVAAVAILLAGTRTGWPRRWLGMSAAGIAAAAALGFVAPAVLAAVMTGAGVALRIPQLAKLLRSASVEGVSMATWGLGAATAGLWLIVSIHRHATAVAVANVTALLATLILLGVLLWKRRTAKPTNPITP